MYIYFSKINQYKNFTYNNNLLIRFAAQPLRQKVFCFCIPLKSEPATHV